MAGYGAKLEIDMRRVQDLPTGTDRESTQRRRKLFCQADMSGNGILSLAECDRLIVTVLQIEGLKDIKPVINRAFHAARDIVPPVADISPHYVDFHEFRYFLTYLQHYLELFMLFTSLDKKDAGGGRYSDRRLSFKEFKAGIPTLLKWGLEDSVARQLRDDPAAVWREIDDNEGGLVLFDEFAHWALYNHIWALDGGEDPDMAEALEVLRKQKPNLCGKDLKAVQAAKAKYRVDAPISGQGCLRGDEGLFGGEAHPTGAAELAAGGHYPGGLAAWEARLAGAADDRAPDRCPVAPAKAKAAWKASFARCEDFGQESNLGPKLCRCGCERPAFGRFATCCTHCKGPDGPHAADCLGKGYLPCENGCGRMQFGRFTTCCTHCKGAEGPHARDCMEKMERKRGSSASAASAGAPPPAQSADLCAKGCGRPPFKHFKTCCTHCQGPEGPHAADCHTKVAV